MLRFTITCAGLLWLGVLSAQTHFEEGTKNDCNPMTVDEVIYSNVKINKFGGLIDAFIGKRWTCIFIEALFPGGCIDDDFNIYWTGKFKKTNPMTVDLLLTNDGSASCNHTIYKAFYFDITPVLDAASNADSIVFRLVGYDGELSTTYYKPMPTFEMTLNLSYTSKEFITETQELVRTGGNKRQSFYNGNYTQYDKDKNVRVKGQYRYNRKEGEWLFQYDDGVKCIRLYKDDHLISEKFIHPQPNFEGILVDLYPEKNMNLEYEIKNGVRNGTSIDYYDNKTPWLKLKYKDGSPKNDEENFNYYIMDQIIEREVDVKTIVLKDLHLMIDRIRITGDYTFIYLHYQNDFFTELTHGVRINPEGSSDGIMLKDTKTGKRYKMIKAFNISTYKNAYTHVRLGELVNFILVYEKIPIEVKEIEIKGGNYRKFEENGPKIYTLDNYFNMKVNLHN
ncbi:MAG: hypothetical protein IH946_00715 [Bacteroidetes bacterium]|nr:hypothetical protein [Bacteroidota bacterium]